MACFGPFPPLFPLSPFQFFYISSSSYNPEKSPKGSNNGYSAVSQSTHQPRLHVVYTVSPLSILPGDFEKHSVYLFPPLLTLFLLLSLFLKLISILCMDMFCLCRFLFLLRCHSALFPLRFLKTLPLPPPSSLSNRLCRKEAPFRMVLRSGDVVRAGDFVEGHVIFMTPKPYPLEKIFIRIYGTVRLPSPVLFS